MGNRIDISITAKDMASNVLSSVSGQIDNISDSAKGGSGILERFGGWLGGVFQTAMGFITANVFNTIASSISNFIGGVIQGGADLERLKIATYTMGENMGVAKEEIDGMVKSLEDTNTWGVNAYTAISSLTRTGLLDMVGSLKVVDKQSGKTQEGFDAFIYTIKDLSAAMGITSSKGIEVVTQALITQRDESLQGLGINVNLRKEFAEFAKQTGRTADELTNMERSQVILNSVMEEGEKVAGVYSETYKTSGKNLLSIKDAMESTQQILGELLNPAVQVVTNSILDMVKGFREFLKTEEVARYFKRLTELVQAFWQVVIMGEGDEQKVTDILESFSPEEEGNIQKIVDTFYDLRAIAEWLGTTISTILTVAWEKAQELFIQIQPSIESIWESLKKVWNIISESTLNENVTIFGDNLVGAITQAIVDLVDALATAFGNFVTWLESEEGRSAVQIFSENFKVWATVLPPVVSALSSILTYLVPIFDVLWKFNAINMFLWAFKNLMEKTGEMIALVQIAWDNLVKSLAQKLGTGVGSVLKLLVGKVNIPAKQSGGHVIASKPTLMMVGEKVPERIDVTPIGSHSGGGSSAGNITININGAGDPVRIAQEVQRILARANQSQGLNYNLGYRI